jgi:hypothetical protein
MSEFNSCMLLFGMEMQFEKNIHPVIWLLIKILLILLKCLLNIFLIESQI